MVALLSSPEHLAALREGGARKRREAEEAERRRVEEKKHNWSWKRKEIER